MVSSSPPGGTLTSALLKLALAPGERVRAGGAIVQRYTTWPVRDLSCACSGGHVLVLAGRVDHPAGHRQQLIAALELLAVHMRRDQRQRAGAGTQPELGLPLTRREEPEGRRQRGDDQ